MIKNLKQDDGLEEVKVKLNEVINVLIWENPMATVEKVAQQHLIGHNRQIAQTRDDLKATLVEVKTALEKIDQAVEITDSLQDKIKQFIGFYAQVGIYVKELCDGKK